MQLQGMLPFLLFPHKNNFNNITLKNNSREITLVIPLNSSRKNDKFKYINLSLML